MSDATVRAHANHVQGMRDPLTSRRAACAYRMPIAVSTAAAAAASASWGPSECNVGLIRFVTEGSRRRSSDVLDPATTSEYTSYTRMSTNQRTPGARATAIQLI